MNTLICGMKRSSVLLFWALLIVGVLLRLLWLGRASYMIDEVNVVQFALQEKTWFSAYQTELDRFQFMHRMPLLVIFIRAAAKLISYVGPVPPEWIARLPFALMGIATLPLMFCLGRRLGGDRAGLLVLFLVTLSPFHLFYSREAYDYAMVMFFSAGALWAGLELLRDELANERVGWRRVFAFEVFAIGLLHSHLAGLVFLTCMGAATALLLLRLRGLSALWRTGRLVRWALIMAVPLLVFSPFLLKMLGGGWVDQEGLTSTRMTWAIVPGLLGRMGWGEGWPALIPFSVAVAAGLWASARAADAPSRRSGLLLIWTALLYLALQTWMLRFARFETRYFSPVYPCLLVFAAMGLGAMADWAGKRVRAFRTTWLAAAGALLVGIWLAPSAWAVIRLECRGYNYKGLAQWLAANLPENGIYSYWNVYDGRGVPGVYPVPGRHMAYPLAWSNEKDYIQFQVRERLIQFFQRFPTALYVETAPADLLQRDKLTNEPVPRDRLFVHQLWLEDAWAQRLIRWKTHPFGEAQWFGNHMDKWLISYNRPEDLPELARRQGRLLYSYFGPEWVYRKDNQMNDWMSVEAGGTFQVGNIASNAVNADIRFTAFAYPAGCKLNVYSSSGGKVLDQVQVSSQAVEIRLPPQSLAPGRTEFFLEVLPPPGGAKTLLLLYSVATTPSPS